MELQEYIRSKCLPDELMFELFDISRRDSVAEGLIDYIADNLSEAYGAEDKISELECNLEQRDEEIKGLEDQLKESKEIEEKWEADAVESFESFKAFLEAFKEKNERHPSIDETWDAVWESSK
jgi:hypothetical protein